jgi:hypothetical protein
MASANGPPGANGGSVRSGDLRSRDWIASISSAGGPVAFRSPSGGGPVLVGDRAGQSPPAGDDREARVLSLLAGGRLRDALTLVDGGGFPAGFAALARADARVRSYAIHSSELQGLCTAMARVPEQDPALQWWASALLAEGLGIELDPAAVDVADQALAAIPTDDLLPLTALAARGRLRRVAAARALFCPAPGAVEASRRARVGAVADFVRCGQVDEALLTGVIEAAARIGYLHTHQADLLDRMLDIRRLLDAPGSLWIPLVDHVICVVAAVVGDHAVGRRARERLAAVPDDVTALLGPWPAMALLAGHLAGDLDDDALAAIDAALRRLDRRFIRYLWAMMLVVADRMVDAGHPDGARRGRFALDAGGLGEDDAADRALLRLRFSIAAGSIPPVDEVVERLRRLSAEGRPASAAHLARVLADGLASRSAHTQATVVRTWDQRTPVSSRAPVRDTPAVADPDPEPVNRPGHPGARALPGSGGSGVHLGVLCPVLEVTAQGREVRLGQAAALLLVHLVVADGPLHIEQVGDLLWPDASLPVIRQRLNSLLHRLRRQHPAVGRLVGRTGDVVLLDRSRCGVDLDRFDAPAPGPAATVDALCAIRGNLCHVQFPYDERLIEARHRVAARWTHRAAEAVVLDASAGRRLTAAALALGLDPEVVDAGR